MTIAAQVARASTDIIEREAKGVFFKLALMLLRYKRPYNAAAECEAERVTPRVANILKTAVTSGSLTDWSSIADYQNVVTAFTESLRTASVFDAVLADGMPCSAALSRLHNHHRHNWRGCV